MNAVNAEGVPLRECKTETDQGWEVMEEDRLKAAMSTSLWRRVLLKDNLYAEQTVSASQQKQSDSRKKNKLKYAKQIISMYRCSTY